MSEETINRTAQKLKKELKRFDDIIQNEKEYDDNDTKNIQLLLDKIFKATTLQSNKNAGIIYEMQALIYWLDGNISEAITFAKKASTISDNGVVCTKTAKDLISKNRDNKLAKIKSWIKHHKKIIIAVGLIVLAFGTLSIISFRYKQIGDNFFHRAENSYTKTTSLGSSYYVYSVSLKDEDDNYNAKINLYNKTLTNYNNSRKTLPIFVSSSEITEVSHRIDNIKRSLKLNSILETIDDEISANDYETALKNANNAIEYAESNKLESTNSYRYLAMVLQHRQKRGDSADPIIEALNKSYDSTYGTVEQSISSNDSSPEAAPDILVMYGTALEVANRDTEAIPALNYAIKNIDKMKSCEYKNSLMSQAYYYLSVAYSGSDLDKSLSSINSAVSYEPKEETLLQYQVAIQFLQAMSQ